MKKKKQPSPCAGNKGKMDIGGKTGYVGRGGDKLKFALENLRLTVRDKVCADFGCNIGGFTDCLIQEGASHVYAVDTGYGMLEWRLRCDRRVTVMERTNAMHLDLPEKVDIVTIDVGWTTQIRILPSALRAVKGNGAILSLFKPQYEAPASVVRRGLVAPADFDPVLCRTLQNLKESGIRVKEIIPLPQPRKRKNMEAMLYILPSRQHCHFDSTGTQSKGPLSD